ncbi:hypothetical protein H9P43_010006 [Blastocladiella emersonii ATCC 22665]|nr:hypothetical protein H9P43_010006 [Blastocladiella emersonii ATCC 22665]
MESSLNSVFDKIVAASPSTGLLLLDDAALTIKATSSPSVPTSVPWPSYASADGGVAAVTVDGRRYLVHKRNGFTLVQTAAAAPAAGGPSGAKAS